MFFTSFLYITIRILHGDVDSTNQGICRTNTGINTPPRYTTLGGFGYTLLVEPIHEVKVIVSTGTPNVYFSAAQHDRVQLLAQCIWEAFQSVALHCVLLSIDSVAAGYRLEKSAHLVCNSSTLLSANLIQASL